MVSKNNAGYIYCNYTYKCLYESGRFIDIKVRYIIFEAQVSLCLLLCHNLCCIKTLHLLELLLVKKINNKEIYGKTEDIRVL